MQKFKTQKGITLIALIITIIVMLILVGVSVTVALNGGLFSTAQNAVDKTQIALDEEQALDEGRVKVNGVWYDTIEDYVANKPSENQGGGSTGGAGGASGDGEEVETIPTTTSYVGCYADFNGDGTPEGIIYADLAHTVSGRWNNDDWSDYAYTAESGLKSYYVKNENYTEGVFDNNDENDKITMIAPVEETTGKDRFYVMALEDIATADNTTFYWYYNAKGKLNRKVAKEYNDFGGGKSNTIAMLSDWNNNTATYGEQNTQDLWGVIQNSEIREKYPLVTSGNDSQKWFVPSKSEWAAFGDYLYTKLGVSTSNFGNYELSDYYCSSTQYDTDYSYGANFDGGYIGYGDVNGKCYVRLSATF